MQHKTHIFIGSLVLTGFILFSYTVRETEVIWLQTRILGLISYAFLFASVTIGEVRVLTKGLRDFGLFRFHIPVSVAAVVFTATHFISAYMDSYKWGKNLTFTQYLGLSYTDIWLTLLSIGVVAFYIIVLVAATSATKTIKALGFGRWKAIHVLAYAAFFMAYIHAVNLGTDVKHSMVSPIVAPAIFASFTLTAGLFGARVLKGVGAVRDATEAALASAFLILLLLSASAISSNAVDYGNFEAASDNMLNITADAVAAQEAYVSMLENDTSQLRDALSGVGYG